MRFKLPDGCRAASHGGVALMPDRDGVIDAHPDAAAALAAHGIEPAEGGPSGEREPPRHAEPAARARG